MNEHQPSPPTPGRLRHLDDQGYLVLPDILSAAECDAWSAAADGIWERERAAGSHETGETGVRFSRNPLRWSPLFDKAVSDPTVLAAVRHVLGADIHLYLMNSRRSDPGHGNQPLHDLNRRRGKPYLRCNTIWCLDEFTAANGSTRFIPGSHLDDSEFLPKVVDPALPHPDEINLEAPRGSVVIFNSHLIHGGSQNDSAAPRRCIHSTYGLRNEEPYCDWRQIPESVRAELSPASLDLLELATAAPGPRASA